MKTTACVCALLAALVVVSAAPAPEPAPAPADDTRPEIIEIIAPAANAQETLATLNLGAPGSELSERNKRTIGILRQLFPSLTQIIEQKVQQITSFVLKTFGPVFLRAFLGRGNNAGGKNAGGGSGTVELDDDDDDDDEVVAEPKTAAAEPDLASTSTSTTTTTEAPSTNPPVSVTENADPITNSDNNNDNVEDNTDKIEDNDTDKVEDKSEEKNEVEVQEDEERRRRKRALFFIPNAIVEENQLLSGAESQQAEVRVAFGDQQANQADQQTAASEDQQAAAAANSPAIDEITLEDADDSEDGRNKRSGFLNFGGSGGSSGGGGSGNFLFDIVRQAPGAMARAAGSAFRLFAGTDSLNVGLTASHTASLDPNDPQLVAGSSSGSSGGGDAGAEGEDGSAAKGDNLTEGVPGPITRLFIIANRGIANLIQDLILRIAQTSERIVNFKARLITSII